jgi:hypothetical protein
MHGHSIQVLYQDSAKEYIALIKTAKGKDWILTFTTKLTARKVPQQNAKDKMAYTVIVAQMRSMLFAA